MDNAEFRSLWVLLEDYCKTTMRGTGLQSLNHGARIDVARRLSGKLESWCREYAARAKGEHDNEVGNFEDLRERFGREKFDAIEPDHAHGLQFGELLKP